MVYTKAVRLFITLMLVVSFMCMPVLAAGSDIGKKPEDFEKMADEYITKAMKEGHIAGAVVVVVKDGKIFFKKGYGYSDVEKKLKTDADNTLFNIASVTKLFTATAAMQMVEQGKIDLNADINEYLKAVKIENKFDTPVTMANLLTNTGGFEESGKGFYSETLLDQPKPLHDTIRDSMPPVITRPGEIVQYSNHGYALIGYVVEQVSGMPFNTYIEENIFKPLGMKNSSYFLSPDIMQKISRGYVFKNDHFEAQKNVECLLYPAGSFWATGDDMGKFLIAQLQNGKYENNRILQENTAINMHTRQFTVNNSMTGYAYGFYQNYENPKIIMHDGDTDSFSSLVSILPEKNIGFFISYNTPDDGLFRDEFEKRFYKFFNVELDEKVNNIQEGPKESGVNLKKFEGKYVFAQRSLTGIFKMRGLFFKMSVGIDENGNVDLGSFDTRISGKYTQIEKNLFFNKDDNKLLYLKENKDGKKYIITDMKVPMQTMEKLGAEEIFLDGYLRSFVFIIAILGVLMSIINLFRRNRRRYKGTAHRVKLVANIICFCIIAMSIALIATMPSQTDSSRQLLLVVINFLCLVIGIGVVVLLISGMPVWKEKLMPIHGRVFNTLVGLAGIGAVAYVYYMDLLFAVF